MQAGQYESLIARKLSVVPPTGITAQIELPADALFPHQDVLTRWSLKRCWKRVRGDVTDPDEAA